MSGVMLLMLLLLRLLLLLLLLGRMRVRRVLRLLLLLLLLMLLLDRGRRRWWLRMGCRVVVLRLVMVLRWWRTMVTMRRLGVWRTRSDRFHDERKMQPCGQGWSMGLPFEETIGGRGQTGEQVKGTGGRSYVVRHMSKTGRRLGQATSGGRAQARTADGMGGGKARAWARTRMCAGLVGERYVSLVCR
jgi:hypothetical protein